MKHKLMIFLALAYCLNMPALAQDQGKPNTNPKATIASLQIKGGNESTLGTLKDRQLGVAWKSGDPQGLYTRLWVGTMSGINMLLTPPFPVALPPNGPAGGRLTGAYPNPVLAASGVSAGVYGSESRYPVLTIAADGTITTALTYPLPAIPSIPASLPPSGSASGDLTGTYPAPTLVNITTAKTVGSSTQVPVITTDAKGRVTALSSTTLADPFTQKIRTSRYTVPSLLGLAISDVAITWSTPFSDANYTASVAVQQSGALAGILVDWCITGQTPTGITVRIKNIGLSAQSPIIQATAIHD